MPHDFFYDSSHPLRLNVQPLNVQQRDGGREFLDYAQRAERAICRSRIQQ